MMGNATGGLFQFRQAHGDVKSVEYMQPRQL